MACGSKIFLSAPHKCHFPTLHSSCIERVKAYAFVVFTAKNGDFFKSKNQNSYFVFDNIKICLAKNSSIKFREIKNKNVILEHIRGNLLVNKIKNKSLKIEISIYKKFILDVKGKVYINQFDKNKFILRSFFGLSYKPFYSKKIFKLKLLLFIVFVVLLIFVIDVV